MLEIYPIILSFVADVAELTTRIGHHDPDLARQLRRASTSVVLNTAEAMHARGRSRTACYNSEYIGVLRSGSLTPATTDLSRVSLR
jgi:hypothetical protein